MPMLDMPVEELKKYQGVNPRPEDFDDYWDRAIAEMHAVDQKVELIKADFQTPFAECFHMYYTGVRGARIHAKLIMPVNAAKPSPAVVMFHGYTDSSRWWNDKLQYAAAGFVVAAMDCSLSFHHRLLSVYPWNITTAGEGFAALTGIINLA